MYCPNDRSYAVAHSYARTTSSVLALASVRGPASGDRLLDHAAAQVRDILAFDNMQALELDRFSLEMVEQADAVPQQHRGQVDVDSPDTSKSRRPVTMAPIDPQSSPIWSALAREI